MTKSTLNLSTPTSSSYSPPRKYFPLSKAYGDSFCNRIEETSWLIGNLQSAKHSLLIAPRRYGKSSLAEKAIAQSGLLFIKINFHLCTTDEDVAQTIINNVTKLIGTAIGQFEKIMASIKKYVSHLSPKLIFGDNIVTLELMPQQKVNLAEIIAETLLLLENLLREKNKKAVIFFDEFQEIAKISKETNIEGAIRTAAQEMSNLSLIFSGSIRSLLLSMFDDEHKPLYKLCRKLKLDRIAAPDYKKHLAKIALATWRQELSDEVFDEIMRCSNRHPYYVNYLCDILWAENPSFLPNAAQVRQAWQIVIEEEWGDAVREISSLSITQRKILKLIATHDVNNLTSHETSTVLLIPPSTLASAANTLIEKDYIEPDSTAGKYKIINPLLVAVLNGIE